MSPIRTLIVDDSAVVRRMLAMAVNSDDRIAVIGSVDSAIAAREAVKASNPDVITLDMDMPGMNGAGFLAKLMAARPTPTIMVSTEDELRSPVREQLLQLGAFAIIERPTVMKRDMLAGFGQQLCGAIHAAGEAAPGIKAKGPRARYVPPAPTAPSQLKLIAIGSSTGGVPAVQAVLSSLGANAPPIAIAQHMPDNFTARFAKSLATHTQLAVHEASDGLRLGPGVVAIAPGGSHLSVERVSGDFVCRLQPANRSEGPSPSVDVLFHSVAKASGAATGAAILTGMGSDGAAGLEAIRNAGGFTAAQDQASCVVFGMPRAAIAKGAAAFVGPPHDIALQIMTSANYEETRVA